LPDVRAGALFFPHVLYPLIDRKIRQTCRGGLPKSRGEGFGKLKSFKYLWIIRETIKKNPNYLIKNAQE